MAKRNGHHWHQYVFPIESAFEYSHQLNRNESSNGFHILRSHFYARILKLKVRLNIHISLTGMSHQMVFIFCAHIFMLVF